MLLNEMATDFRISEFIQIGTFKPKQIFAVFLVLFVIPQSLALSVWMPQFLTGGHGRNIRHLPCVSRKTGEQGICMFAYTCMKSNGTHLGTCIDRFYFGSCCKLEGGNNDLLADNQINIQSVNNNQVSSSSNPVDESKIHQNLHTTSLPNSIINKHTVSGVTGTIYSKVTPPLPSSSTSYSPSPSFSPAATLQPPNTVPGGSYGGPSTHKTGLDSAQNLATQATNHFTPSTDKIFIPIHTSLNPNKTDTLGSSSGLFTTHGSSSSIFSASKRPTTLSQSFHETSVQTTPTTTQNYYLSTFQVVHNENSGVSHKPATTTVFTKVTTLSPSTPEPVTTWTPIKHVTTASTTQFKKNVTVVTTRPTSTTTRKPSKPVKPVTTTRKPPPKKPTSKPTIKPSSTAQPTKVPVKKPSQPTQPNRHTTPKPAAPVKKPTQPTKKPILSSPKPTTSKPTNKPVLTTKPNATTTTGTRPSSPSSSIPSTTRPVTTIKTTYATKTPAHSSYTTTETVFTRPASIPSFTEPSTDYGITTFRPDLSPTSKKPGLITGSYLTTFNYTTEGIRVPSTESPPSTISNEISSETIFENNPEIEEENTNIISQLAGSTAFPGSIGSTELTKQNNTFVPFFPEATEPSPTKPPWIQIVQSTRPSLVTASTTSSPLSSKTTTTTKPTYTVIPLLPGVNTSDYTQVCGRRLFPQSRVVGGEKSTFGKWPWQISLRQWRTSTYLHKCGAALLNENWAITAAHCVENVPPSDLLLRLGEHDLSTEDEPYGFQERRVQIVASHPQFDPRTFEYDLALLRFYEPVKFQPNIIPVCVPEDDTNFVGQTAYVTGWGRLYEDGPLPSVLQEVSVPVINNTLCENMYRSAGYIEHIPEIFICAGWKKGGFDSCEGDSGGPMVIQRPDKRWLLAGVISWGIGCAEPNQPGVYTRISEFREWIHQILQF